MRTVGLYVVIQHVNQELQKKGVLLGSGNDLRYKKGIVVSGGSDVVKKGDNILYDSANCHEVFIDNVKLLLIRIDGIAVVL